MKRLLLILLAAVLVIGVLAGAGYAGYRIGFRQGVRTSSNGDASPFAVRPDFNSERRPFPLERGFDRGFDRGFPHRGFQMTHSDRGRGFGFFAPFRFLGQLAIWGLIILLIYLLFARSGWRLTRTGQTVQSTSPNVEPEPKPQEQGSKNE
ncbi:MAG: hypothetical protein L0287_25070 [Anaerolineae bacterium]|nr:hypothetical protein [Anaerolineae bacterium]MCI0610899.1 hypothetical protein [Anaerolineae bacterium]